MSLWFTTSDDKKVPMAIALKEAHNFDRIALKNFVPRYMDIVWHYVGTRSLSANEAIKIFEEDPIVKSLYDLTARLEVADNRSLKGAYWAHEILKGVAKIDNVPKEYRDWSIVKRASQRMCQIEPAAQALRAHDKIIEKKNSTIQELKKKNDEKLREIDDLRNLVNQVANLESQLKQAKDVTSLRNQISKLLSLTEQFIANNKSLSDEVKFLKDGLIGFVALVKDHINRFGRDAQFRLIAVHYEKLINSIEWAKYKNIVWGSISFEDYKAMKTTVFNDPSIGKSEPLQTFKSERIHKEELLEELRKIITSYVGVSRIVPKELWDEFIKLSEELSS